ncbi:MAG TPA: aminotransferase class III-fold pyridoxal phosphate-dependent enzyme [Gemmatimonadaceae bacterium]|nr:aminotransferase class III-fold pyridoxal phosphate-dependent enzyme [Gemmatimonadaceae bacterium]
MTPTRPWHERAERVLPTGASTGSKRADALYGIADVDEAIGPTHFVRASGCRLETSDGAMLVDCTMALGSVALGYAHDRVVRAVSEAAQHGNVGGVSHTLEVELAERLCTVIPCAEKVQFLKSGAEAIAAAVRIARTYTVRDVVIGCGYFGWLDWSSTSSGVPAGVQDDFRSIPFDDVGALERAVHAAGNRLAAIVLEPIVERLPSPAWLAAARAACDANNAVLIFDEIKTGFRVAPGGYQQVCGVTPDLAAFGKAMANGFPLSVVCGRASLMDAARRTWISSTLASETTALAAARAVLDVHAESDACASLAATGAKMRAAVQRGLTNAGADDVRIDGIDPMWFLRFDSADSESRFVRVAARNGVLFKRGAYNFASLAHDDDAMKAIERAATLCASHV